MQPKIFLLIIFNHDFFYFKGINKIQRTRRSINQQGDFEEKSPEICSHDYTYTYNFYFGILTYSKTGEYVGAILGPTRLS